MKLWTIQSRSFVVRAQTHGAATAVWGQVEARWRDAFRWISSYIPNAGDRGGADAPPVWAWHSCGAWQQAPADQDIDALLGGVPDDDLRRSFVLSELEVPAELVLLTRYGRWNEILWLHDIHGSFVLPSDTSDLFDVEALEGKEWSERGNADDIQACFRELRGEWVRWSEPLTRC